MNFWIRTALHQRREGSGMIKMRRTQLNFGDALIAEEVSDLREDWMKRAETVLAHQFNVAMSGGPTGFSRHLTDEHGRGTPRCQIAHIRYRRGRRAADVRDP